MDYFDAKELYNLLLDYKRLAALFQQTFATRKILDSWNGS